MEFPDSADILIVGANSSFATSFMNEIQIFSPRVHYVSRSPIEKRGVAQHFNLDLLDKASITKLVEDLAEERFDLIYIFSGAVSELDVAICSIDETIEYYGAFAAGLNFLMGRLQQNLKDTGTLIFISSRAAHRPSYDEHYSAVKASSEAFLKSIASKHQKKRFIVLAPSLIRDTNMYNAMSKETISKHLARTSDSLLTLKEAILTLIEMSANKTKYKSGETSYIGRDW